MTQILVTGAEGFVGSQLIAEAMQRRLPCLGTALDGGHHNETIRLDVRDPAQVSKTIGEWSPRVIIHCAGITSQPTSHGKPDGAVDVSPKTPPSLFEVNVVGTRNLLRAAKDCGVSRFVFLSSEAVYGVAQSNGPTVLVHREGDALEASSDYASAKIQSERDCAELGGGEMKVAVVRLGTIYGPDERVTSHRERVSIPNRFINLAKKLEVVRLSGAPRRRSYCHVGDAARLLVDLSLLDQEPGYSVYNLGGERLVAFSELVDIAERLDPSTQFEWIDDSSHADLAMTAADERALMDTSRLKERLGPLGLRPLADGMEQMLHSMT